MTANTNNWSLGEITVIPKLERFLKKSGRNTYNQYVNSRYMCIREESSNKCGILIKVLGKTTPRHIKIHKGEPFSKDEIEEQFYTTTLFSYPYPTMRKLDEVLNILRTSPKLVNLLEEASMHINLDSTFWVRDTKRTFLFQKKLQYLDGYTGELCLSSSNQPRYRVSIIYFFKGELIW
ncbi:hypothetical protein L6472_02070 [Prevotella sp. E13-17]|uniref:hypothetical protein n=1 Tax=Prevotella sp. E13-17 TaxID=2913616 RepID=UPI001EDA3D15|nr:hypothetical protein [Prevotella sp. E13-17]UKK51401.1 hypothetical protein L6472_02070 [Prevotella sp. E13-17]